MRLCTAFCYCAVIFVFNMEFVSTSYQTAIRRAVTDGLLSWDSSLLYLTAM